jgi:elongation factor P hydroxylase
MPGSAHQPEALIELFDALFGAAENTRLVRGSAEPLYLPPGEGAPHGRIVFAHGFFASALHEIAHWCVAGPARRRLVDYGYWYKPDGRSATEQREFEQVEVRPQALEWIFSRAAGREFHFSADNLGGSAADPEAWGRFRADVAAAARAYLSHGLPARARRFTEGLSARFGTGDLWRDTAAYRVVV